MDDTTRLTSEQSIKLFIQRDYSEGTAVKFQERFPSELDGKVNGRFFCFFRPILSKLSFRLIVENSSTSFVISIQFLKKQKHSHVKHSRKTVVRV